MLKYSGLLCLLGACAGFLGACASGGNSGVESTPESTANFAMGVAAYTSGQYPAALGYFSTAERLAPDNPSYEMHTGMALMALERNAEAEREI